MSSVERRVIGSWILSLLLFVWSAPAAAAAPFIKAGVLLPSQPQQSLMLGRTVAVSGDVAVVGAPFLDKVFVYRRTPGGWGTMTEVAQLAMSDVAPDGGAYFGGSLAIEGDVIVVGAAMWRPSSSGSGPGKGAVFVYVKPAGGWQNMTETARLTWSGSAPGDRFGESVAIAGDTIAVGAPGEDHGDPNSSRNYGAVYVFVRPQAGWASTSTPNARLVASDPALGDGLGSSVALSGTTLVAGAPLKMVGGEQAGAAYVFQRPGGGWSNGTEVAKLRPASPTGQERFGRAVAIGGSTVVVGAPGRHDLSVRPAQYFEGAAYIFEEPGSGWSGEQTENAVLQVSDGKAEDAVGSAVAMWSGRALLGAPFYGSDATGRARGAVAVFDRPPGGWSGVAYETMKITPSDATEGDRFGEGIAVSGPVAVIGAPYRSLAGFDDVGRAYVYEEKVLCTPSPRTGCRTVVTTAKGSPALLLSKSRSGVRYDRVIFRWFPGSQTDMTAFGDPTADRTYGLCVYDEGPSGFSLIVDTTAPPGGLCAARPCWRLNRSGTKWLYRDRELTPDGMLRLDLVSGPDGKARIVAVARGARAGVPSLPLLQNQRVVAQVVSDTGDCWSAEFTAPARVNSTSKFRDND